ncbi:MAG: hypothetical protein GY715_16610 [Planctomycetes bacterium]|nr:hypothetical protein [Planctomycetota bacterium]
MRSAIHPVRAAIVTRLAPAAVLLSITGAAYAGTIEGVVLDQDTMAPLEGALVSLQASGLRTTTASDGSYTLTVPNGTNLTIVGASKGYFNESINVTLGDEGVVGADILLDFVPQDDDPGYFLFDPMECRDCHPDQYDQWIDSPMQKAGLNTWVHDIYNGQGTPGGMGGFVYTEHSIYAGDNPNSECASCHQPESWIYGLPAFSRMEGPQDVATYPSDTTVHGISCDVCHKIAHVNVENINYPGIFPGGLVFTRPAGEEPMQVQYGLLGDADYDVSPLSMRPSYQPQLAAEVCAACHQDANDPEEDHTFTGIISEPTYLEWVDSPYGDPASPFYADCVDCHMPPSGAVQVCNFLFLNRDPDTIRSHTILGTTPEYLENAAEVTVTADTVGDELQVQVDVFNAYTGHHLPTGVTVRNMILLVEAWRDADGEPLASTGDQVVHELGGVGDPADGYYAGLPGKYFSKVNHDASGNGPTFFTDAAGIVFDNRIPALETDTSTYSFQIPPGGGALRVRARLIYRRAFRFLVDAKQWTETGHGQPLADVAAPHYGHLMEDVEVLLACGPEDLNDDSSVDFSDIMAVISAWGPCSGCPEDLNGNGTVDFADILLVIAAWGPCP